MKSNNNLNTLRKPLRYLNLKKIGLVCVLLLISISTISCNRLNKDNIGDKDTTEETINQPTPSTDPVTTTKPTPTLMPELTARPTPIIEPTPTVKPETTAKPNPTRKPTKNSGEETKSDFIPSKNVMHSPTALAQGNYLFYKTGKLTKTVIASKNNKTSKVTELAIIEDSLHNSGEFYLKESDIYYHEDGDIYRVGVDGKNKTKLYSGTATILGLYNDDVIALERKTRELIRINKEGDKKTLTKIKSIDTLEAVMVKDGIYYISKSSNNTLEGKDPDDRLYYIDVNGKNKKEVNKTLDIYDLQSFDNEVFFLSIAGEPEIMKVNKVEDYEVTTLKSLSKEELEALGCQWFEANTFTLLAANATHVYYGVDFNNGKEMNIYSVETDGSDSELFLNAFDIKGINASAYFMRGEIDDGYLKVVFDCDENPVEIYLIHLQNKASIKFEGKYYRSNSIDVEGEYVYYCKSSQPDPYGEIPEAYEYGRSKISVLN
jgi:hypothetical protein